MEDDEISITSTVLTLYSPNHEFEVEGVLAEKLEEGDKKYLLSWLNYPEHRNSWETKDNINNEELITGWEERKRREARGLEKPYDVVAWEEDIQRRIAAKKRRHQVRVRMRRHLNQPGSHDADSDSESSEAIEVDTGVEDATYVPQKKQTFKKAEVFGRNSTTGGRSRETAESSSDESPVEWESKQATLDRAKPSSNSTDYAGNARPEIARQPQPKILKRTRSRSESSPDIPLAKRRIQKADPTQSISSSYKIPKRTSQPKPATNEHQTVRRNEAPSTRGGKTATRGSFANGRPRNLLAASANPNAQSKPFDKIRYRRMVEVRARGLADREPNIEALGEHYLPARPGDFQSMTGSDIKKVRDGDEDAAGLFVDTSGQAGSRNFVPEAFIAPPYQPVSKGPPPDPNRATCYYYDRAIKDPSQPPCTHGQQCQFLHSYEPGVPVAQPPDSRGKLGDSRLICYYWDMNHRLKGEGSCSNPKCTYLHEYIDGVQVAPKPPNKWELETPQSPILLSPAGNDPNDPNDLNDPNNPKIAAQTPRPIYNVSWGSQAICSRWFEGGCPDDRSCPYIHSMANDLPIGPKTVPSGPSPSIEAAARPRKDHVAQDTRANEIEYASRLGNKFFATCWFWDRDGHCTKGFDCSFLHSYRDDAPLGPPPPSSPEAARLRGKPRSAGSIPNESNADDRRKDVVCRFWEKGNCWDGRNCLFRHSYPNGDTSDVEMSDAVPIVPESAVLRDDRSIPPLSEAERTRRKRHEPEQTKANMILKFRAESKHYATCYEWDVDFRCERGAKCNFLHAYRDDAPLAPAPLARVRPREVCPYWKEHECYRSANDCAFRHTETVPESSGAQDTNGMHPSRLSMLNGRSSNDKRLGPQVSPQLISNDTMNLQKLPAVSRMTVEEYIRQDSSWKVQQTCKFWEEGRCTHRDVDCEYFHDHHIPRQRQSRVISIDGRKKILRPCRFWIVGHCQRSAEDCEQLHYIPSFEDDTAIRKPILKSGDDLRASLATRPIVKRAVTFNTFDNEHMPFFEEPEILQDSTNNQIRDPVRFQDKAEIVDSVQHRDIDQARRTRSLGDISFGGEAELRFTQHQHGHPQIIESPTEAPDIQSNMASSIAKPKAKKTISFDDYKRSSTNNLSPAQSKEVVFANSLSVIADFRELVQLHQSWVAEVAPMTKIKFNQMCMAHDLKDVFAVKNIRILWNSNLVLASPSESASSTVDLIANEMKLRTSALSISFSDFVMLVYPNSPEWRFLDPSDDDVHKNTKLRFAVFEGTIQSQRQLSGIAVDTISPAIPHRKALMKRVYGLEVKSLIPAGLPASVFLVFPPANDTTELLTAWLHASCLPSVNLKVYGSQKEGAWDFFLKEIRPGTSSVFLIHESMIAEIWQIPNFLEAVQSSSSFWCISDSGSPYPMYPSHHTGLEESPPLGHMTATILLPHGHAFLLTPSFIVAEPTKVLDLINWFLSPGGKHDMSTRGTWKLVACHDFARFAYDLALAKIIEATEFKRIHYGKPAYEQMLLDKGLDYVTCKVRYSIHAKLAELQQLGVINFQLNGSADEQYSRIMYAPASIDQNDEQALVEWFACWAIQKLDKHRKFTVIGTGPDTKEMAFRGVDAEAFNVTMNDQIDQGISTGRSSASRQGLQVSTSSCRPSQSPAQAQNSPALSPHFTFSVPQSAKSPYSPAVSKSVAHSPTTPMDIDSDEFSSRGEEEKSSEKENAPIVFEPTVEWYARLKASGRAYEHILVEKSSTAFRYIGVGVGGRSQGGMKK